MGVKWMDGCEKQLGPVMELKRTKTRSKLIYTSREKCKIYDRSDRIINKLGKNWDAGILIGKDLGPGIKLKMILDAK